MIPPMPRIDVHSHLLPAVDDGCATLDESLACARALAAAGYSHCFCTPHAWPSHRHVNRQNIPALTADLQDAVDAAGIPLRLIPGSELNLHPSVTSTPPEMIVDLGLSGRHILVDMWADKLPPWFDSSVRWLQSMGLTVILAHPERMRAVQDHPSLVAVLKEMGVLLQGNLQCFADRPDTHTRRTAERFLLEGHYFVLGSDTHSASGLKQRLIGLQNATELVGSDAVDALTIHNPRTLLPSAL